MGIGEIVMAVGVWYLSIALFPQLRAKSKPPLLTSFQTGVVIFCFGVVFLSWGLYIAALAQFVNSVIWFTLLIQEKYLDKETNPWYTLFKKE